MEVIKVKLGKLKTNAKGNIEMTRKELREYMQPHTDYAIMITLLSCISWLMEDEEFKQDRARLNSIFHNVQRIILTTLDPNEPFNEHDLARVVRENTDIDVRFIAK